MGEYLAPNSWLAFDFDQTIVRLGMWVENNRFEYDKKGNRKDRIEDLLSPGGMTPFTAAKYRYASVRGIPDMEEAPMYTREQWEADKAKAALEKAVP